LDEEEARKLFSQLTTIVENIHARGWVHHDLSHQNILVDKYDKIVRACFTIIVFLLNK
jgi:serine/threonine protein kinase